MKKSRENGRKVFFTVRYFFQFISRGKLKRMMETPIPDSMMDLARRTFIFLSLTGLDYADICGIHPRHIGKTSERRMYIRVRNIIWYEVHGMGVALGMKENLSYQYKRHSFGTLMLTASTPMESIAKMMGHININSTQVYAQVSDLKISGDMDRLIGKRGKRNAGKY